MNNLNIMKRNEQLSIYSIDIAGITGRKHDLVLRDIKRYKKSLDLESTLNSHDFFRESTYMGNPCYLITEKGCDMIANKMRGTKRIGFTGTYVTKFRYMQAQLDTELDNIPKTHIEYRKELAAGVKEKENIYHNIIQGKMPFIEADCRTIIIIKDYDDAISFIKEYAVESGFKLEVESHDEDEFFYTRGSEFMMIKYVECSVSKLVDDRIQQDCREEMNDILRQAESARGTMIALSELNMLKRPFPCLP